MIRVVVRRHGQEIVGLMVSGHAMAAPQGHDLVCAGASSISVGLLNAIDRMAPQSCRIDAADDRIAITVLKQDSRLQTILMTGLIQLQTIGERYPANLKIETSED